ncbi:GntR family transcriptional regulator/MocR family aminotransferase [Arcanobacterium pluranimalium]|uniref:MocR-like pyridoxine biosynthesis transcription factor PdxR n=1 Tax=Arcanobacterium pluranimalium TaxID=108028 RepID=UPI00195A898B|nr:PLP-dependent aminotransferase family protein [Arcanobacterium pluranimalium]MBM7825032.1 GntR family transcriptional regulator/MocR family aminotransferase [Arcanobacterium pluranimalium]
MAEQKILTYSLEGRGGESLYSFLYSQIKGDIEAGRLAFGQKLPSKRRLAQHLGISVITVENAYAQLVAEGYVNARARSGYYVSLGNYAQAPHINSRPHHLHASTNSHPHSGDVLGNSPSAARSEVLAHGVPECAQNTVDIRADLRSNAMPTGVFPYKRWAKTVRDVLSQTEETQILAQVDPCGAPALREQIASYLYEFRGMDVDPQQIVVAAGAQTLYSLLIQLLGRHRSYAVEDPGYWRLTEIYQANAVSLTYVPLDDDGIRTDILQLMDVDVAHVMPSHQFPTGTVTSISRRYELLAWAAQRQRYLIEDDYDVEFRLAGRPIPSLFGMDATGSVIYVNTFSKSLGSMFRIGYMVLPMPLAQRFRKEFSFYSGTVSTIEQLTLARFIETGAYERHINRLRGKYRAIRDSLLGEIAASGLGELCAVKGQDAGLHFELRVEVPAAEDAICERMLARGVRLMPMNRFYQKIDDNQRESRFVVSYGSLAESEIPYVVDSLSEAVRELREGCVLRSEGRSASETAMSPRSGQNLTDL